MLFTLASRTEVGDQRGTPPTTTARVSSFTLHCKSNKSRLLLLGTFTAFSIYPIRYSLLRISLLLPITLNRACLSLLLSSVTKFVIMLTQLILYRRLLAPHHEGSKLFPTLPESMDIVHGSLLLISLSILSRDLVIYLYFTFFFIVLSCGQVICIRVICIAVLILVIFVRKRQKMYQQPTSKTNTAIVIVWLYWFFSRIIPTTNHIDTSPSPFKCKHFTSCLLDNYIINVFIKKRARIVNLITTARKVVADTLHLKILLTLQFTSNKGIFKIN